jgi:hypothetical protein
MIPNDGSWLSQHDALGCEECLGISERIHGLKSSWIRRGNHFFTLGTASYIDAVSSTTNYQTSAKEQNCLLLKSFEGLLQRVRAFVEHLTGENAFFDESFALPGFHIFTFHGEDRGKENVASRAHFDLQWMNVLKGRVPRATLSFTLPIQLPSGGASMAVWPIHYSAFRAVGVSASDYAMSHPFRRIEYVPGRLVAHDGLILHAIGAESTPSSEGFRITLQGHGIKLEEGWMLYW